MPTVRRSPDAWDNCRACGLPVRLRGTPGGVLRCEDCRGRGIQPTPRPVKVVDRSPLDWETRVTFRRYRPDSRRGRWYVPGTYLKADNIADYLRAGHSDAEIAEWYGLKPSQVAAVRLWAEQRSEIARKGHQTRQARPVGGRGGEDVRES
jgi:uncharacterized protein (DUF433 family)